LALAPQGCAAAVSKSAGSRSGGRGVGEMVIYTIKRENKITKEERERERAKQ